MSTFKVRSIFIFLIALVVAGCNSQTPTDVETAESVSAAVDAIGDAIGSDTELSESGRLNAWLDEQYEAQLMRSPMSLTYQGRKERYGEIDDFSEAAHDAELEWMNTSVATMQSTFDYEALNDTAKLSYDLWAYMGQEAQEAHKWRRHEYAFHQMSGWHTSLPTFLMSFHLVETQDDLNAYVSRISETARAITQVTELAQASANDDIRPPRFAYEIVSKQSKDLITGFPFDVDSEEEAPIWGDVNAKAAALVDQELISQEDADTALDAAKTALLDSFGPAYTGVIEFLASDIENTSEQAQGVMALPNGKAAYEYNLWSNTSTRMTADEIHELGLAEVARIQAEMEVLREKSGFEGDLQAFFAMLRESKDNELHYFPNTDEGRQGYIDGATEFIDNIETQLGDFFGILPKAGLVVKRVESFREQDGAPQHYYPSTPDGSRPGIYYAHLSDMGAMPKRELEVIAYHEGLPGHHMQIAIAQELEGIPEFRKQAGYNGYIEGWALYSEKLATEIPGTYQDVYSDFGRLGSEIWRAVRLVVDTGMHAKGWSQQQAVDYFAANAAATMPQIEAEIRRYLVIPGQATGYKVGMITIQNLRAQAEQTLGEQFDIRLFHDAVLDGGALPLELLERKVNKYIEDTRQSNLEAAEAAAAA